MLDKIEQLLYEKFVFTLEYRRVYTHVSKKSLANIESPIDRIFSNKELDNSELSADELKIYKQHFLDT